MDYETTSLLFTDRETIAANKAALNQNHASQDADRSTGKTVLRFGSQPENSHFRRFALPPNYGLYILLHDVAR